jgi:hypothetical protein
MENDFSEIRAKIIEGIELAFYRLVVNKSKENEELIFSENDKIVRIKARKLLKELNLHQK